MGCERGVLEQEYSNSEMLTSDGADGIDYFSDFSYYPERSQRELATKQYTKLKPKLTALYAEAITPATTEKL